MKNIKFYTNTCLILYAVLALYSVASNILEWEGWILPFSIPVRFMFIVHLLGCVHYFKDIQRIMKDDSSLGLKTSVILVYGIMCLMTLLYMYVGYFLNIEEYMSWIIKP